MQCRQYGGDIRHCKEMVRLLLHFLLCNKGFFFYIIYQKNPLLHKKITVGEYLQKKEASVKLYCDNCSFFRNTEDGKEAQQLQLMWQIWHKDVFGITVFYVMIQQIKKRGERQWI